MNLGKLKIEEKMHILAKKEEGILSEEVANQLDRHRSSFDCLMAKAK
jgi:IS30 family transposase